MQILTQEERKNLDSERTALGDISRELADVQRTEAHRAATGYRPPPSMVPGRQTAPVVRKRSPALCGARYSLHSCG